MQDKLFDAEMPLVLAALKSCSNQITADTEILLHLDLS